MKVEKFVEIIGADFYTGVPDSQLKALCNYLIDTYGTNPKHHVIAANEGNCTAIAAGYNLATGKIPVVYMQNSGEGNVINPLASLLSEDVYGIPVIFVIGWRGEPGVHDEPQHIYQGKVTLQLMNDMDVQTCVVGEDTTEEDLRNVVTAYRNSNTGKSLAIVIRKNALVYENKVQYANDYSMNREEAIRRIVSFTGNDPIISTTGKISRELFEIRETNGQGHEKDFLTVGSMGHASSIALGVAIQKPDTRVWCIDGDGALLMHMGALVINGSIAPSNLVHIVINNGAHETVGGMPTATDKLDMQAIAKACGYERVLKARTYDELAEVLSLVKEEKQLCFIEVCCTLESRSNLGRPTTTAKENISNFVQFINKLR